MAEMLPRILEQLEQSWAQCAASVLYKEEDADVIRSFGVDSHMDEVLSYYSANVGKEGTASCFHTV